MALREEPGRRNQRKWRSQLERERLDLSASVEAALVDDGVLEQQWQDEADEQEDIETTTGRTSVVPPRLSLQSKMLPAVRSGSFVDTATNSYPALPKGPAEAEQKAEPLPQNTGMLARLAQRFTSSFAAIGGTTKSGSLQQAPAPTPQTVSAKDTGEYLSPISPMETDRTSDHPKVPLVRVIDTMPPSDSVVEATSPVREKQRSLKRNARVRLETAELHAIPKTPELPKVEEQETGASLLSDVRDALDRQQESQEAAQQEDKNVPARLPVLEMFNGELDAAARGSLSGSGAFESGQGDVTIANARITASSVVLVTLTTNPGPVVVQYISLQPQVGFTVHLTAPTATRTTFNYVVLLGELF
jgi:hypothetical protein